MSYERWRCASLKVGDSCCKGPAGFQLCPSRVLVLSFSWVSAKPVDILEMHTSTLFPYSFSNQSCFEQAPGLYNSMSYVRSTPLDGDFASWAPAGQTAAPLATPADGAPAGGREA